MGAALLAALKALPELVSVLREVSTTLRKVQISIIDLKYERFKGELNEIVTQLQQAENDQQRRDLINRLADKL